MKAVSRQVEKQENKRPERVGGLKEPRMARAQSSQLQIVSYLFLVLYHRLAYFHLEELHLLEIHAPPIESTPLLS